ncbi:MAG: GspE/PulE family protein, partial [bacterium]
RFRVDGFLRTKIKPPMVLRDAIVSRVKIMANLDIGERRLPQEGRSKLNVRGIEGRDQIDLRVSTLPTLFGEKVTLRILDQRKLPAHLGVLGLDPVSLSRLQRAVNRAYGMVLVTGPTGSGKTSTLYTCLGELNSDEVNIMTVEDPVEICLPGINQIQINEQIGRTYAKVLRSFLRQDPDVVMVGEIRDFETAEIAVKAALTGHLVLSTLHTNDAPSAIDRLVHMGVPAYLVANSVNLICAQRLVRTICQGCVQELILSQDELESLELTTEEAGHSQVFRGSGCSKCEGTGFKGRTGLFEVMEMSSDLRQTVVRGADVAQIRHQARRQGMLTLRESGLIKVHSAITTRQEV